SEVKRCSADGSVGSPHARVGHCQASNQAETPCQKRGVFAMCGKRDAVRVSNTPGAQTYRTEMKKPPACAGGFWRFQGQGKMHGAKDRPFASLRAHCWPVWP
ncbi:hypothetical protein V6S53_10315, partial [Yersinia ruckeri]|uniref:hypothetical protein n=2 Tax=Yersinia ruckeri TaxID=29486 RepID=UPI001C312176